MSVAVFDNFKIVWMKSYGVREAGTALPVTLETTFQAASISKPVTAMAVMRLVQQGKLSLDENINDKLVSWKVPDNDFTTREKVTLRRLASSSTRTATSSPTTEGTRDSAACSWPSPSLARASSS